MFGIDFCDVKMKSRYHLKFSKRHPHYMQFQQRLSNEITEKISKRRRLFPTRGQSWNMKHETSSQKRKSFQKLHRFKHELKTTFFQFSTLNRGGWNVGEKRWGKQSYLATSREDIREAHTILAYCFTDLCLLHVYTSIHQNCLNAKWFTVVSFNFGSFSQTEIISHAL